MAVRMMATRFSEALPDDGDEPLLAMLRALPDDEESLLIAVRALPDDDEPLLVVLRALPDDKPFLVVVAALRTRYKSVVVALAEREGLNVERAPERVNMPLVVGRARGRERTNDSLTMGSPSPSLSSMSSELNSVLGGRGTRLASRGWRCRRQQQSHEAP